MFRDYHISSAKAADFANLSLIEFRQELAQRNIYVNYDSVDWQQELQTLKTFFGKNADNFLTLNSTQTLNL